MFPLLSLYLVFFKIGAFSFGGGYAMLPFIEKEIIEVHQWLSALQFMDILALSQMTPGPIAINAATFIGYRYHGFSGSLIATLGIVSAPFVFMSAVFPFIKKYRDSRLFEEIFRCLKPVTLGLILSSAYSTGKRSILDPKSLLLFLSALALLRLTKLHPIALILGFGVLGLVIG